MEDITPSRFFAANYRSTYIRERIVGKMMIKHHRALLLIVKRGKDNSSARTLGITHIDSPNLYISSEENLFLIIPAAEAFVKNDYKHAH